MDNEEVNTTPSSESAPEPNSDTPALAPNPGSNAGAAVSASQVDESGVLPPRRVTVVALVAVIILAIDIVTKVIAVSTLEGKEPVRILGGAVYLQLVRNSGAAFSLATGMTWLLALVAITMVVVIIWLARRLRSTGWAIGLGLILAGALGNLTDRIFRAPSVLQGHVIDFVSVFAPDGDVWPVFNVADSAICVGAVLVVLLTLLGKEYDGGVNRNVAKQKDAQ